MVLSSYEARWFFPGPLPDRVEEAFWSGEGFPWARVVGDHSWQTPRADTYLPFSPELGIKTRREPGTPPRLEFKGLVARCGPFRLGEGLGGRAEHWVKWSYGGDEVPAPLLALVSEGADGITVRKQRVLRKIRLEDHAAEEVPTELLVRRAVQIELTRVEVSRPRAGTYWTLGFEAFPADEELPRLVRDVAIVRPLLTSIAEKARVELREELSRSYPEWLVDLVK